MSGFEVVIIAAAIGDEAREFSPQMPVIWLSGMRRKITKQLPNTKSEVLRGRLGVLSQVPLYVLFKEGAGSRARTDDLLITNHPSCFMEIPPLLCDSEAG